MHNSYFCLSSNNNIWISLACPSWDIRGNNNSYLIQMVIVIPDWGGSRRWCIIANPVGALWLWLLHAHDGHGGGHAVLHPDPVPHRLPPLNPLPDLDDVTEPGHKSPVLWIVTLAGVIIVLSLERLFSFLSVERIWKWVEILKIIVTFKFWKSYS